MPRKPQEYKPQRFGIIFSFNTVTTQCQNCIYSCALTELLGSYQLLNFGYRGESDPEGINNFILDILWFVECNCMSVTLNVIFEITYK